MTLEQLGSSLLGQMSFKQDPEKPVKWKKVDGPTDRVICTPFDGAKSGSRTVPIRFALIELTADQVVLLGFVFPDVRSDGPGDLRDSYGSDDLDG
jgi:hypothetical protein